MRARLRIVFALSMWTFLLLLASNFKATAIDLTESGEKPPAPSLAFQFRWLDRNDQEFSVRRTDMRKRGSNDQESGVNYAFFKRGDGVSDSDDAEMVSAGKRARNLSNSDDAERISDGKPARKSSDSAKEDNNSNDAEEASDSDGESVKKAGDVRREVTQKWIRFEMILKQREIRHKDPNLSWSLPKEIRKLVNEMLGPPSAEAGDDFSRLILIKVPLEKVGREVKKLNNVFTRWQDCGWAKAQAISNEDSIGTISILRYVPEGAWPEPNETHNLFEGQTTGSSSSSLAVNVDHKQKLVKFNFEHLGWPSDKDKPPRPWLIKEQWNSRPEVNTDLIFFNVPLDQKERVIDFIDSGFFDHSKPEVDVLSSNKKGKCRLRLRLRSY
ncbi:hypothetical protein FA10DRAFT_296960 [Acaromyces ingoldii]|uniref:Uncharacterized protein n=1 Tax=Acaromyces ingoldii TaxID=215250 RepID=A0A316YDQ8_9BASI|nr:hypothetical protein FA10DRAFT_296960 [Acaromyces ingoldii]PWN87332.1 hypothetical protein FA10DRAFT_296960 [Acaromyces ingoldii]